MIGSRKLMLDEPMSILDIKEQGDKDKIYATSKEYLQLVLNKAENKQFRGPPEMMWGVDLCSNYKYGGDWLILAADVGFNFAIESKWIITEMNRHSTNLESIFRNLTMKENDDE